MSTPTKFVKPADLFKMRRRTSTNVFSSLSNSSPNRATSTSTIAIPKSPIRTPNKHITTMPSPRPRTSNHYNESPLKLLNNVTDPSPQKNIPVILKNPFRGPVKRRLNLSPVKKSSRMQFQPDNEDANLEPPKMRSHSQDSPNKRAKLQHVPSCYANDYTLRTKLRINFNKHCKNWNGMSDSTHRRNSGIKLIEESPSKINDKTISIEAIKNATTVYQHPYMAWMPLYPRTIDMSEFDKRRDNPFSLTKHSQVTKMMHKDWCESLDDLVNLLADGRCPYFYLCSDNYNILFKSVPSSNPRKPVTRAYVAPFSYGMGCELNKLGVDFKCPDIKRSNSSTTLASMARDSSQASFGSASQTRTTLDDENSCCNQSSQQKRQTMSSSKSNTKISSSIDSGNISDLDDDDDDDEDLGDDENDDASQFLESIGLSQQDFPSLQSKRKAFVETASDSNAKSTSNKPLAAIVGTENVRKLIKFLQGNRLYTINSIGKFACIPPTLLAPCEFRLCTPQSPEVILSKNMIETSHQLGNKSTRTPLLAQSLPVTPRTEPSTPNSNNTDSNCTNTNTPVMVSPSKRQRLQQQQAASGPTFFELRGTVLPNVYEKLHKLLMASENHSHSCLATPLEISLPFGQIAEA